MTDQIAADCIDLDMSLATFLAPRLRHFANCNHGFPAVLDPSDEAACATSYDDFQMQLRKSADAFQDYIENTWSNDKEVDQKALEDALLFVASYFHHLWL
jgi:hypothetical protein